MSTYDSIAAATQALIAEGFTVDTTTAEWSHADGRKGRLSYSPTSREAWLHGRPTEVLDCAEHGMAVCHHATGRIDF